MCRDVWNLFISVVNVVSDFSVEIKPIPVLIVEKIDIVFTTLSPDTIIAVSMADPRQSMIFTGLGDPS